MKSIKIIFFTLICFIVTDKLLAHPVIYKDGFVVSSSNMKSYSDNQVMYSWSNKWSSGLNLWRFSKEDKNTDFYFLKLNHLLYRYNGDRSQANIYLHGGLGVVDSELERKKVSESYMTGLEADWESRNLYTALKYYYFTSPRVTNLSMNQARIGFSPYEAEFDQLQSWFMLQFMHTPDINKKIMITPMMRFFYKNILWEVGVSTRADWMLNLMVHY